MNILQLLTSLFVDEYFDGVHSMVIIYDVLLLRTFGHTFSSEMFSFLLAIGTEMVI